MFQDLQVDEISSHSMGFCSKRNLIRMPLSQLSAQVDLRDQMASVKGQVRGDTTPLKSEVQELRFGKSRIEFLGGLGDASHDCWCWHLFNKTYTYYVGMVVILAASESWGSLERPTLNWWGQNKNSSWRKHWIRGKLMQTVHIYIYICMYIHLYRHLAYMCRVYINRPSHNYMYRIINIDRHRLFGSHL